MESQNMKSKSKHQSIKTYVKLKTELRRLTKQREEEMNLLKHLAAQQKYY